MPDWLPLRRMAQERFRSLTQSITTPDTPLPSAEEIIAQAAQKTEIESYPVREGDVLLFEAHAVLDRQKECIWYAHTLPSERKWLVLAHEYAHFWLHPDIAHDQCQSEQMLEEWVHPDDQSGAVGYNPLERREREEIGRAHV